MLIKVKCICAKWHFSSCAIESVWPQHWGSGVIDTNCVQNDLKTEFLSGYASRENACDLELGVVPSSLMLIKNTLDNGAGAFCTPRDSASQSMT